MKPIETGDEAPDFTATTADGQPFRLADYRGKQAVVLFFYPSDNSPICTMEACSFRDVYEDFVKLGAVVIGVSSNSEQSHREFATTHRLPYLMISDAGGALRQLFGVPNVLFVLPGRTTYVIDQKGIVRQKFNSQLFGGRHVQEALKTVRKLTNSPSA